MKFQIEQVYSPTTYLLQHPRRSPSRRTSSAPSETRNMQFPHGHIVQPSLGTSIDTWYPTLCRARYDAPSHSN
jgi:hypothetical protein